jgi:hypothetical protein
VDIGSGEVTDILLDNASVRATEVRLNPGASLSSRRMLPHLLVAITDVDLGASTQGKDKPLRLKAGDFSWADAGETGTITNTGSAPATFIQVEFR